MSTNTTAPKGSGGRGFVLRSQRKFLFAALMGPVFWSDVSHEVGAWLSSVVAPAYQLYLGSEHPEQDAPLAAPRAVVKLAASSMLQVTLRPARRIQDRVVLRAFVARDGQLVSWPVRFEQAATGVFHLRAPVWELPNLQPGTGHLLFLLSARPLPSFFDRAWDFLSLLGWWRPPQILTCAFEITAAMPPVPE